jgi:hypothetical protein
MDPMLDPRATRLSSEALQGSIRLRRLTGAEYDLVEPITGNPVEERAPSSRVAEWLPTRDRGTE